MKFSTKVLKFLLFSHFFKFVLTSKRSLNSVKDSKLLRLSLNA